MVVNIDSPPTTREVVNQAVSACCLHLQTFLRPLSFQRRDRHSEITVLFNVG